MLREIPVIDPHGNPITIVRHDDGRYTLEEGAEVTRINLQHFQTREGLILRRVVYMSPPPRESFRRGQKKRADGADEANVRKGGE